MDGLFENGDGTTHSLSGFDVTRKVLSFGYFSLHQQRKVTRRQAKALLLLLISPEPTGRRHVVETCLPPSWGKPLRGDDEAKAPKPPPAMIWRRRPSHPSRLRMHEKPRAA